MFKEVELVTRKKNFYKNVRVSNSKREVILRNRISLLDFVTREFRSLDKNLIKIIFLPTVPDPLGTFREDIFLVYFFFALVTISFE